jgi:hypothetical protein
MNRVLAVLTASAVLTVATQAFAGPTVIGSCGTVIKSPGSYVLNRNLSVKMGGGDCITISSSNVTVDLQGYRINCNSIGTANGIIASGTQSGITIRNGFVTGCVNGVDTYTHGATGVLVDEILALNNSNTGIAVNVKSQVMQSIANGNKNFAGIFALCPSNIIYNTAINNLPLPPGPGEGACDSTDTCYNDIDWFPQTPCSFSSCACNFSCNAYDHNQQIGLVGGCP